MDKRDDPRFQWYLDNFGRRCVELDALNPKVLRDRVGSAIVGRLDIDAWNHATKVEEAQRESMENFVAGYAKSIRGQASKYSGGA